MTITRCVLTKHWAWKPQPARTSLRRETILTNYRRCNILTASTCALSKLRAHFRWKQNDVFLSQALWGEPVGLLPVEDGIFTIYFAHVPLARFEEKTGKIYRMPKYLRQTTPPPSGSEQACSDPENKNLPNKNEKLSGMCPV
jgi:hypothetical protein